MAEFAVIDAQYFGPTQYFSKFLLHPNLVLDDQERFRKQSFRNRCEILNPQGRQSLIVPVSSGKNQSTTKELRISYDSNWPRHHRQAILSAYGKAPFFEHYWPEVGKLLEIRAEFLFDLNYLVTKECLRMLKIDCPLGKRSDSIVNSASSVLELNGLVHPKPHKTVQDPRFNPKPYLQCFPTQAGGNGFESNLSVLDLLFNEGPSARTTLSASIVADSE